MQEPDGTSCHDVLNPALPGLLDKEPCTPIPGQVLGPIQGQARAPQEPPRSRESLVWERSVNVNFGSTAGVCVCVCVCVHIFVSQNTQGKHARIKIDSEMNEIRVALPRVQV